MQRAAASIGGTAAHRALSGEIIVSFGSLADGRPSEVSVINDGDNLASDALTNDDYEVFVAVTGADGTFVANYAVVEGSIDQ